MEFGQYQLQIFVSLVVILGAAFVALICDFLKGNNEQLRELTIELQVRREEERKRSQLLTARTMESARTSKSSKGIEASGEKASSEKTVAAPRAPRSLANPGERKRMASPEALAAMERGAQLASVGGPKPAAQSNSSSAIKPESLKAHAAMTPAAEAILARAKKTEAVAGIEPDEIRMASASPVQAPVVIVESHELKVVSEAPASSSNKPFVMKKDWNALLSARRPAAAQVTPAVEVREDMLEAVSSQASSSVPAGFHEGLVLSQLVQSRQPVSGLVVSIGVSTGLKGENSIPEPVKQLVQSLIGPGDFACQSGDDEFLLIYPDERGASAQRRLSALAQQLWDFQLRSLGNFSILFSWGGVEVKSESIDEAIASATERMQETKRGRKVLEMPAIGALRQAV